MSDPQVSTKFEAMKKLSSLRIGQEPIQGSWWARTVQGIRRALYSFTARDLDMLIVEQQNAFNSAAYQTVSALKERLDSLESKVARQEAQLNDQATRLARQEAQLNDQATRLARQEAQLNDQATRLARQETQLNDQATRLAQQEAQPKEQMGWIALQEERLKEQMGWIALQEERLKEQMSWITRQGDVLKEQHGWIQAQDNRIQATELRLGQLIFERGLATGILAEDLAKFKLTVAQTWATLAPSKSTQPD